MPRQRMIKPEFFDSSSLAECSFAARLAFIGLWVMGDDKGNAKLALKKLKRQIFPDDDMSLEEFEGLLAELENQGCIKVYEVDGDEYINTPNFTVYQTVKNPSKTTIPEPPETLKKKKTTNRFRAYNPSLTQDVPTTNPCLEPEEEVLTPNEITVGEEGSCTTTNPVLTHDRLPNKERSKEVIFFPKEKNITPTVPTCPLCHEELIAPTDGFPFFECKLCGAIKEDKVVWSG